MKLKLSLWIIVFIMLVGLVSAVGVSPERIIFEDVVRGGYAEQEVQLSELSSDELLLDYEVIGTEWVEVEFEGESISISNPTKAKIKINVPENAGNDEYEAKIRIMAYPKNSAQQGKASTIISAVSLDILFSVIGEETVSCAVGGISIANTEKDFPIEVSANIKNTGNVRIRPDVQINVLTQDSEQMVLVADYSFDEVLPTTTLQLLKQIEHELEIGQYWAEINILVCGYEEIITFDVVEKGTIVDKGELVRIEVQEQTNLDAITPITALFKNTGQRTVSAKFKGEVLRNGKILDLIETELVDVAPGEAELFETYYQPTLAGTYEVKGRIVYNEKLSYEKQAVMNVGEIKVEKSKSFEFNINYLIMPLIIIVIIILLLLIIIRKKNIRKISRRNH